MEWTKIPVDLLQTRKTDKEILAIVKYQLLWAMLERRPDDDVALRYMTSKQLRQARDYVSSIEHCVDIDIKSAIKNRKRQKIFYTKKQSLIEKPNGQTNNKTNDKTNNQTTTVDKIREDKNNIISSDKSSDMIVKINDILTRYGLSKIRDLTDERKTKLKERCHSVGGFDNFLAQMEGALAESSFLRGDNKNGWSADFDFFLQKSSWQKVIEGKYRDKQQWRTIEADKLNAYDEFSEAIAEMKRRAQQ